MAIEHASVQVVRKPWGVTDLHPWSDVDGSAGAIGELWFQRVDRNAAIPALLLKLLFTSEPLSIQVHPDDAFARSIGLSNGKTEAWYILSAIPGAKVAVGLNYPRSATALRTAITDGSIANIVHWRPVHKGDVIFIPAGTIHAIGAGIVLAEIQQYSDATFRLFDYGRQRELHIEKALAVSDPGPVRIQPAPRRLTSVRTGLIANPHFVFERIDLPADSIWSLNAAQETWIMTIEGHARIGLTDTAVGDVVFVEADRADIEVGPDGTSALIAYSGPDFASSLLQDSGEAVTSAGTKSTEIVEAQT
jgi:mannose-6-phosphate isomerase